MYFKARTLKKIYDLMGSEHARVSVLGILDRLKIRKNIVRFDTNCTCNIECIMCGNRPRKCTDERMMTPGDFRKIIDRIAPETRILQLSCGYEPLMNPHFLDFLSYAKSRGIPFISFATNGLLLNENVSRHLVAGRINEITVSFNGMNSEDYNRIMFRSNYDTVIRNLTRLTELKKSSSSPFPRLKVNMMLFRSNIEHYREIFQFIQAYDIDTLQIREVNRESNALNNPGHVDSEMISTIPEDSLQEISHAFIREMRKLSASGRQILIPHVLLRGKARSPGKGDVAKTSCSVPFFSHWIGFDGNLRLCTSDKAGAIGNIIHDEEEELSRRRRCFLKTASRGECSMNCVGVNIDSSDFL